MNRKFLVAVCFSAFAATVGCSRPTDTDKAVATPSLSVNHQRAPLGSPIEVTYKFVVAADAPRFTKDYRVFVHFLDSNEELMWTDDHLPQIPFNRWSPGQTIQYTRTVFIPIYPYVGDASVRVGIYSPQDRQRLPLAGDNNGQRAYKVATINLLPQSENVFLIYKDGWHSVEVSRDNAAVEWQWTRGESTISFRNPRRDATFYLHFDGRPEWLERPQQVALALGDQALDAFEVSTSEETVRRVPITSTQFGTADMVDLRIKVEPTFVPAKIPAARSTDPRELGVRVFHAFVEPR